MAENDAKGKKAGFSFGFSKKIDKIKLEKSVAGEGIITDKEETDYVLSLEGKEVKSTKPKETRPAEFVIPLIKENNWRRSRLPLVKSTDNKNGESHVEDLDNQAVKEIIAATARHNQEWDDRGRPDPTLTVPLLVKNKVPDGFETDEKLDVSLRPDVPEDADYDQIPIEQFGFAMLRGMGWKDGEGIGKNKELVAPLQATLRPKGLGLGADRSLALQKNNNTNDNTTKKDGEESLVFKKGAFCFVTKGVCKDLYGVVEGTDEDNARVMVKLAVSGKVHTLTQYAMQLVGKTEYDKYSKYINKAKVDKYKEKEEKGERARSRKSETLHHKHRERSRSPYEKSRKSRHSEHQLDSDKETKRKHQKEFHSHKRSRDWDFGTRRQSDESKPKKAKQNQESATNGHADDHLWVRPNIRVRIIDKNFRKGKYYKSKVIIIDVISKGACVCKTEEGKVLEDLSQSMLETVIPKYDPAYVLIVSGKYRGHLGEVVRRNKDSDLALVQLLSNRDNVLKLEFDSICEYVGDIDEEFDY